MRVNRRAELDALATEYKLDPGRPVAVFLGSSPILARRYRFVDPRRLSQQEAIFPFLLLAADPN